MRPTPFQTDNVVEDSVPDNVQVVSHIVIGAGRVQIYINVVRARLQGDREVFGVI